MSHPNAESTSPSDADLVARTREGDTSAYAELWRRHAASGRAAARSFTTTFDPDDLVAEAYTRVFRSIKAGGGPTTAFRAYLVRTIRNVAISWSRVRTYDPIDDVDQLPDPSSGESAVGDKLDRQLVAAAYSGLPERWRQVLWYSEVEALKPRDIAPKLGISPNSVSALMYRAKEALRQAWIQSHLVALEVGSEHGWTIERLGAYSREKLAERDRVKVQAHLDDCADCAKVAAEAHRVAAVLPWALLPLVGAIGVAAQAATAAATPNLVAAPRKPVLARTKQTLARMSTKARGILLAGTAAVAIIALVGTAAALILPARAPVPVPPPVPVQAAELAPPVAATSVPPPRPAAPTEAPVDPVVPPNELDPAPDAGDAGASGSPPELQPSGTLAVPTVEAIAAPVISQIDTGGGLWLPIVSGLALPGALVTVSNGTLESVQVIAAQSGHWTTTQLTGYEQGTHKLTALQTTTDGRTSPAASSIFTIGVPPEFGARGVGNSIYVTVVGQQETTVQLLDEVGLIRQELTIIVAGRGGYRWEGFLPDWSTTPGTQQVAARFGSGGRWGPAVTIPVEFTDPTSG